MNLFFIGFVVGMLLHRIYKSYKIYTEDHTNPWTSLEMYLSFLMIVALFYILQKQFL